MYAQFVRCQISCFCCAREARNVPVEVRMIVERDMILLMQVVTCLCHLYAQGHHLNRSHCVMRVIQDIFTVDAQAVVAQQVEQGGRELSSALFATYWSSHGYRCSPAGICCQPFQASGFSSYSSYNCEFVGDFDGSCAPTTLGEMPMLYYKGGCLETKSGF